MSELKLKLISHDGHATEFIKNTFQKRECSKFRRQTTPDHSEICECGYSKNAHGVDDGLEEESCELMQNFPTDAFGKLEFVDEDEMYWRTELKTKRYVRLDYRTNVDNILTLFHLWKMTKPDVIFSVLSDRDYSAGKVNGTCYGMPKGWYKNVRKNCNSLVETAVSTNAWLITDGLNTSISQLIGNEVKRRLMKQDKIPKTVLGISHWGCLKEKEKLVNIKSDLNGFSTVNDTTGFSLNHHHTHFLLVDDGSRTKKFREYKLREKVELALTQWKTDDHEEDLSRPLIYILIGGSVNAFHFVERALRKGIPVIIAMGTGGAADIICEKITSSDSITLEYLQEIFEQLFNHLKDLLTKGGISVDKAQRVIANITSQTKLKLVFKIVEMLDQTKGHEGPRFRNEIANLRKTTTNELLTGITNLLSLNQISSDSSNNSAESSTGDRMCEIIEQMLVANKIRPENAQQVADDLKPKNDHQRVQDLDSNVLNETLIKIRRAIALLNAIRGHDHVIRFDIKSRQKETIIIEALKKVHWEKPSDLYMLVADWDNETFFKHLLLENWKWEDHRNVLKKLLRKGRTKYVMLMMEQIGDSDWLTEPDGPLEKDLKRDKLGDQLLKKVNGQERKPYTDEELHSMKEKMLFLWCVQKQMPEAAMRFWKQGRDCLSMALVAYNWLKEQKKPLEGKGGYDQMKDHMRTFAQHALDLLTICYADDKEKTFDLLFLDMTHLEDQPASFHRAVDADFKGFFSAAPMQDLFDELWEGHLENHRKFKYIPIVLSEACPLLAPMLLDFKNFNDDNNNDREKTFEITEFAETYFQNVGRFIRAPLVKFSYGFISYIVYLTLFSIVMLTEFEQDMKVKEIVLNCWTLILMIEEFKQAKTDKSAYNDAWNYFDIGALSIYIIGFILRMIAEFSPATVCPECLYVARIVLALSLLVFFFRTLQFLSISESLGPKIYMIRFRLLADLTSFMLILAVFISAYGVVSNVIMYPNQQLNATLLRDVFYDSWWSVLQQFNREEASGSSCKPEGATNITAEYCSNTTNMNIEYKECKRYHCTANNWIVSVLLAFYALFTCIMLLNVLIAMFNLTFTKIDEKHKKVSRMQRYRITREYMFRTMVPPPLCVITYPYHIVRHLFKSYKTWHQREYHSQTDHESTLHDEDQNAKLRDWEQHMVEKLLQTKRDKEGRMRKGSIPQID